MCLRFQRAPVPSCKPAALRQSVLRPLFCARPVSAARSSDILSPSDRTSQPHASGSAKANSKDRRLTFPSSMWIGSLLSRQAPTSTRLQRAPAVTVEGTAGTLEVPKRDEWRAASRTPSIGLDSSARNWRTPSVVCESCCRSATAASLPFAAATACSRARESSSTSLSANLENTESSCRQSAATWAPS